MADSHLTSNTNDGEKAVVLHVYDLSNGMAMGMSESILGKQIDGIWHTGIVVYGKEYFFGGGIQCMEAGGTWYGRPTRVESLGQTHLPKEVFEEFLRSISDRFTIGTYHIVDHNCNHFTQECSLFLTGNPIPEYISSLPREALDTPIGRMFRPFIDAFMGSSSTGSPSSTMIPQFGAGMNPLSLGSMSPAPVITPPAAVPARTFVVGFVDRKEVFVFESSDNVTRIVSKLRSSIQEHAGQEWKSGHSQELDKLATHLSCPINEGRDETLISPQLFELFDFMLKHLPAKDRFPCLDLVRLLIASSETAIQHYSSEEHSVLEKGEIGFLFRDWDSQPASTHLMLLRLCCNLFNTNTGSTYMIQPSRMGIVVDIVSRSIPSSMEAVRGTAASLGCNIALKGGIEHGSDPEVQLISSMVHFLQEQTPNDVAHKMLLILWRILQDNPEGVELIKALELDLSKFSSVVVVDGDPQKQRVVTLASSLQTLIS